MHTEDLNSFFEQWQSVLNIYVKYAEKTGLTDVQLRLLDIVENTPACTQTALCGQLRLTRQHVNALVRELCDGGLLATEKDAEDGRKKKIVLTDAGRALADGVLPELRREAALALHREGAHVHIRADGTVTEHTHDHAHGQEHGHTHTHAHTKAVLDRLARAIGHMEKVRKMVEDGVDCSEVLIQLAAVKAAVNNTGKLILKDHIEHCLVDAVERGDSTAVDELNRAIDQFIK